MATARKELCHNPVAAAAMIRLYNIYLYTFLAIFGVYSCYGALNDELPQLTALKGPVMAACDFLFMLLGCLMLRQRSDKIILGSYIIIGVISTLLIAHEGMFAFFNGTRDFIGMLFVMPILNWFFAHNRDDRFTRLFDRILQWWLYAQAVFITYQFVRYGAGDHGGGTMGNGSSGLMSMTIYMISFYLVARNWDSSHYLKSLWNNKVNIILLYPSFLNETKVSFILFALYFVLLIKFDRRLVLKLLYIVPLSIAILIGLAHIYIAATNQDMDKIFSMDYMEEYLYGNNLSETIEIAMMVQDGTMEVDPRDQWTVDIPRFGKMLLAIPELRDTDGGLTWGAGLGQFKGQTMATPPRFARINQWLLVGTLPWLFFVFVQLGIIGLIWMTMTFVLDLKVGKSAYPLARQVQWMVIANILSMMVYNAAFRSVNFCVIVFYIILVLRNYTPAKDTVSETA